MTASPHVTYAEYLELPTILEAQHPLAPPELGPQVHAAEHFFIVVHQTFELWFKQVLLDLRQAVDALCLPEANPEGALDHLLRVAATMRLLIQQMTLFDHLSPATFLSFRPYLGAASGSESRQFRAVQKALGLRGEVESPVYLAYRDALGRTTLTLEAVYQNPSKAGVYYRLAEALVDISECFWLLLATHVRIAERAIGQRPGTGGTSGVSHLAEGLEAKAFPELWDVRTRL